MNQEDDAGQVGYVCLRRPDWTARGTPHYGPLGPSGGNDRVDKERIGFMKVWIDQDLCTGDGLCEEIAPAVFTLLDDGLAYVKEGDSIKNEPGGSAGMAAVPEDLEDAVVEASEECPGECIFIERD
jgi:ferredoxin